MNNVIVLDVMALLAFIFLFLDLLRSGIYDFRNWCSTVRGVKFVLVLFIFFILLFRIDWNFIIIIATSIRDFLTSKVFI